MAHMNSITNETMLIESITSESILYSMCLVCG